MMAEEPGTHVNSQAAQVGESGLQLNVWDKGLHVHLGGKRGPREPRPGGPPGRRRKHARTGWIAAAAAVVIAAACLVAVRLLAGQSPAATVGVVGNSSLFSDPQVLAYLARQGVPLGKEAQDLYSQGSWAICDDQASHLVANYDVANLGDSVEAQCVNENLTRFGKSVEQHQFNAEPLVIVTRGQFAGPLIKDGVVIKDKSGIYVFNVACYLHLISPETAGIPVTSDCGSRPGAPVPLVTVTDPTQSNSGSLFVATEYMALTGTDAVTEPLVPARLAVIRQHLHPQDAHTPNLMEDFIDNGLAEPMAVVYENDYLYAAITGAINPRDVVMMYPTPDIISDDTLVSWDPAGNKLVEALTSPGMDQLAERDGYRTDGDSAGFVSAMVGTSDHYKVPDTLAPPKGLRFISNHASPDVLQKLTGQVMPGP